MKNLPWRDYLWTLYPLGVILMILLTINSVFGGPDQVWVKLLTNQQQVAQDKATLATLQTKLTALQAVDVNAEAANLSWLDTVLPRTKRIDVLLSQVEFAAQNSGGVLTSYQGSVGQLTASASSSAQVSADTGSGLSLKVQYQVPDFNALVKLLQTLEQSYPLLKIDSVSLNASAVDMVVESSWTSQALAQPALDAPLPDYSGALKNLKNQTLGYQQPQFVDYSAIINSSASSASAVSAPSATGTGNPFTAPLK